MNNLRRVLTDRYVEYITKDCTDYVQVGPGTWCGIDVPKDIVVAVANKLNGSTITDKQGIKYQLVVEVAENRRLNIEMNYKEEQS